MQPIIAAAAAVASACLAGSALAGERFAELKLEQMTPEQRKVAEAIMSGPRKRMAGPFNAWLRSPELGDRLQKVGEYIRFSSSLPPRLNEFAILITARAWDAQYEWYAHYPLAMKGGLSPKVAEELAEGKRPASMQEDEAIVYDFVAELRRDRNVSDATYEKAVARFGERGVVDLIGVSGYYDLVSMTLNVAQVPVPEGVTPPLKPLQKP
jgi:4-carboxymuconolactone decarboxylase